MAKLLTLREAAKQLGIVPTALRNAIHRGTLRATLYGKTWLVDERDLRAYADRPEREYRDPRRGRNRQEPDG